VHKPISVGDTSDETIARVVAEVEKTVMAPILRDLHLRGNKKKAAGVEDNDKKSN